MSSNLKDIIGSIEQLEKYLMNISKPFKKIAKILFKI